MTLLWVAAGLVLGALGAVGHLLVVRRRAAWALKRGPLIAVASMPLGLLLPAAAVIIAAWLSPLAAWLTPLGMLMARVAVLSPRRRP